MAGCRRQSEPMLLLHAAELHGVDWAPDWPRNLRLWQCNCWNFAGMEHRTSACQKLGTNIAKQATGNEPAMQEQNWPTGIAKTRWELIENEKHMSPISKITSRSKPECKLWNQNYPCSHDSLPIIINACNAVHHAPAEGGPQWMGLLCSAAPPQGQMVIGAVSLKLYISAFCNNLHRAICFLKLSVVGSNVPATCDIASNANADTTLKLA